MIEDKLKVRWYVAQYSELTEDLQTEYEITGFDLQAFRIEFDDTESVYPMEGCFPITRSNIEFLEKYMSQIPNWNFASSSYFIESQAI
jgi:hypothetical protein